MKRSSARKPIWRWKQESADLGDEEEDEEKAAAAALLPAWRS